MHMNLDKKVAGVKTKYLLIGIPVVIIGALYLRSRSSSTAGDVTATDTTDAGVPDQTSGASTLGSGSDGSGSADTSGQDAGTALTGSTVDPYQAETGDLLGIIAGMQASAGQAVLDAPDTTVADLVAKPAAPTVKKLTGESVTNGAKATTPAPAKHTAKPAQKKAPAPHHAAPSHPLQHVTAAPPNHASPGTLSERNAAKKAPTAKKAPVKPAPRPAKKATPKRAPVHK